jgi:hypothetical protein
VFVDDRLEIMSCRLQTKKSFDKKGRELDDQKEGYCGLGHLVIYKFDKAHKAVLVASLPADISEGL